MIKYNTWSIIFNKLIIQENEKEKEFNLNKLNLDM